MRSNLVVNQRTLPDNPEIASSHALSDAWRRGRMAALLAMTI
jgi:hypothetical protein